MILVCVLAGITAGLFGNWWLAGGFWGIALILATRQVQHRNQCIDAHPSQLRARQLDHIARRDRVR